MDKGIWKTAMPAGQTEAPRGNLAAKAAAVMEQVNGVVLGKETEVREIMLAFLANGHILLEDIPGVGKTTIARAFSRAMSLNVLRVQFTPDVMPSDLTGFTVYRRKDEQKQKSSGKQVQQDSRPVHHPAPVRQQKQQGSPEHGLIPAAESAIEQQADRIEPEPKTLGQSGETE